MCTSVSRLCHLWPPQTHCPFSPAPRSQLPRGLTSLDMCGVAAEEADVTDRNSWPSFVPGPDPQHGWDTRLSLARLGGLKELSLRYFRWVAQGCVSWMSKRFQTDGICESDLQPSEWATSLGASNPAPCHARPPPGAGRYDWKSCYRRQWRH